MAHPRAIERAVWPTEDYHLARTLVDTTLPEDDLFQGLRSPETISNNAPNVNAISATLPTNKPL